MKIDIHVRGPFKVIRVEDELEIITDLSELKFLIDGYMSRGIHKIAISFIGTSYIYSGAIAVLMECHKKLLDFSDGKLCILEPNEDIRAIFSALHIDKILNIYDSEDELPLYETPEESPPAM